MQIGEKTFFCQKKEKTFF